MDSLIFNITTGGEVFCLFALRSVSLSIYLFIAFCDRKENVYTQSLVTIIDEKEWSKRVKEAISILCAGCVRIITLPLLNGERAVRVN